MPNTGVSVYFSYCIHWKLIQPNKTKSEFVFISGCKHHVIVKGWGFCTQCILLVVCTRLLLYSPEGLQRERLRMQRRNGGGGRVPHYGGYNLEIVCTLTPATGYCSICIVCGHSLEVPHLAGPRDSVDVLSSPGPDCVGVLAAHCVTHLRGFVMSTQVSGYITDMSSIIRNAR